MREKSATARVASRISLSSRSRFSRSFSLSAPSATLTVTLSKKASTCGRSCAMAKLRPHVDAFFDKVTVNVADGADKEKLRENRLRLLNEIREATRAVADFSRIEG